MPRQPPETAEGWYALHEFRTVDWDAWRDAPQRTRDRAIEEGIDFLASHEAVADAEDGSSAVFSILGHKADLLVVHFRPTMADLDTVQRAFEQTAFAEFTDRVDSYVSVTEVGGYTSEAMTGDLDEVDPGLANYVRTKLYPTIPDAEFVCFYPMDKRRGPENNWYDLPFDERAEMIESHGAIGKGYAGRVVQVITGSLGMDDYEWGVTLWSDDPTDIKELLYEMRFDEGSSKYADFGPFHFGRRFPPTDLPAFMAGETIPTGEAAGHHGDGASESPHGEGAAHGEGGPHGAGERGGHAGGEAAAGDEGDVSGVREELADMGVYAGQPHGEDVYALVVYSEAERDELDETVTGLTGNFDHYDTHVKTAIYEDVGGEKTAVVSLWETERAASIAGGYLSDLPGVVGQAGEGDTFSTLGMFYTVKPEFRGDFLEKFETVGGLLGDMDGHLETALLANVDDENDMFIASEWADKDAALEFFRAPAFRDTVDWGREILADRPRHVFLA